MRLSTTIRRQHAPGFTLTEVLVAMVLTLIITSTIFTAYRYQMFTLKTQETQLDVQQTARSLIDLMSREVRRAGYDPTCAKSFAGIADARAQLLQIQFDSNADGAIGAGESITYSYDSVLKEIDRTAGGAATPLVSGVSDNGLAFAYYDGNGVPLAPSGSPAALAANQRTAVRRVKITLHMEEPSPDPLTSSQLVTDVGSNIDLRNRFLNTGVACP